MTKPIILVIILCVIQGVTKVTSWPQLISNLLPVCNVASDWPRTFFTPQVFLFSIHLTSSYVCSLLQYSGFYISFLKLYAFVWKDQCTCWRACVCVICLG